MYNAPVFRATVTYSSSNTGEIKVRIPTVTGPDSSVPVSTIGRKAYNGVWQVPQIGEQIVVTADDGNLTNVFWVQTNPSEPVSLTGVEDTIVVLQASLSELQSYTNVLLSGIFR